MTPRVILARIALFALIASCTKEKDETPRIFNGIKVTLDVHNSIATWRYFSFESNAEVNIADFEDTLGWDLGIHYESFRTNGGASGIGQGAVLDLGIVDFDNVTISSIENRTFIPDDSIMVIVSVQMPPLMETVPGCELMESVFESPAGPPPHTYTPNNHTYIIRTAKGRHVKFIGTSFFNDHATEGYLNFYYAFLD
jgi:hypothetical protein